MPPSGPLNPRADGFLGLLQLKNLGENPRQLLDDVRPTLDMLSWYLLSDTRTNWRTITGLTSSYSGFVAPNLDPLATVVGTLTVPAGFMWYLHDATARVVTGVADFTQPAGASTAAAMPTEFGGQHLILSDLVDYTVAPGVAQQSEVPFPTLRNVWLPAGTTLGAYFGLSPSQAAGVDVAYGVTISARYTPIRI